MEVLKTAHGLCWVNYLKRQFKIFPWKDKITVAEVIVDEDTHEYPIYRTLTEVDSLTEGVKWIENNIKEEE